MDDRSNRLTRGKTSRRKDRGLLSVVAILLVVMLLSSCANVTPAPLDGTTEPPTEPSTEVTEEISTEPSTEATEEIPTEPSNTETETPPTGIPSGAEKCNFSEGNFTCRSLSDREITLSDLPDTVTPYQLELSSQKAADLRNAEKEGTGCVFTVVADLAFYDADGRLITEFPDKPVTLTYTFTQEDLDEYEKCRLSILQENPTLTRSDVKYLPVYFADDKWWPFLLEEYDIEGNTITVRIHSWGDRPLGGGTHP